MQIIGYKKGWAVADVDAWQRITRVYMTGTHHACWEYINKCIAPRKLV